MDTWTYKEFRDAIKHMLIQRSCSIDLEVTSKEEAINIKSWAEKDKLKAEIFNGYVKVSMFV